jgi:hypothetical protein
VSAAHGPCRVPNGLHFVGDVPAWVLVVSGVPFAAFMWFRQPWDWRGDATMPGAFGGGR